MIIVANQKNHFPQESNERLTLPDVYAQKEEGDNDILSLIRVYVRILHQGHKGKCRRNQTLMR